LQKIIIIISTILFISCATTKEKLSATYPTRTKVTKDGPRKNIDVKSKKIERFSGKYNIDQMIARILPTGWEKDRWFKSIDYKNGYASMGGYMEGYYAYYLFVGEKADLLVEVTWGCGPACEQIVRFYEIENSRHKIISFSMIATPEVLKKMGSQYSVCSRPEGFNSWTNKNCAVMFDFPKIGTDVSVYKAKVFEDKKFQNEWGNNGEKLVVLNWNSSLYKFEVKN